MKKTGLSIIFSVLLLVLLTGPRAVHAQQAGTIKAEVGLMDDYGEILEDYVTRDFKVEGDRFFYRKAPEVEGYVFATANVLRLDNEKGSTYRVHYFYTLDAEEPSPLPEPVPMAEMPAKGAPIEQRKVWVSWTDQDLKELAESKEQTWDFFWETYVVSRPIPMDGFAFQRLETGVKTADGSKMPHFVYVYRQDRARKTAPSLIFEHRIGNQALPVKGVGTDRPEPVTAGAGKTTTAGTKRPPPAASPRSTDLPRTSAPAGTSSPDTSAPSAPQGEESGPPFTILLIGAACLALAGVISNRIRRN